MKINLADFVGYHIYVRGYYEASIVRVIKDMLEPGMTFFDIGAHFGQYTLIASAKVDEKGIVHAFEPGPQQMGYLQYNIDLNNRNNVKLNSLALSNSSGEVQFAIGPKANLGASHLAKPGEDSISVHSITLDDYCDENAVRKIDIMKIDVEGAEKFVLDGGRRILTMSPPKAVFYECISTLCDRFGYSSLEVHEFFRSLGYRIMHTTSRGLVSTPMPPPPEISDFVAIRH
jgi:FkbM family methyltransferase